MWLRLKRAKIKISFINRCFPFGQTISPFSMNSVFHLDISIWKTEYCENASRLRAFVPGTGAWPVGMGLPRAAWVKLNRLRTGVGRFHSSMHKWGLAHSPNCECGASEQTADHVLTACPIHRAPHGARGLTVLDDEI